jgi:two-component system, NtrC family, response regulator HydG
MRADNLKLVELVDRDNDGVIAFEDQRMLLYDADVLGMLRKELVDAVGPTVARQLLIQLGYADGYRDAQTLKDAFRWDTPTEWWKAGLVLHAQEGKASVLQVTVPPDPNQFEAEVRWERCYEVEQHLRHLGATAEPVCWTLAGYVSGYLSKCLGEEVYFIETECCGKGDGCCHAVGRRRADWGTDVEPFLEMFKVASVQDTIARLEHELQRQRQAAARERRAAERWKTLIRRLQGTHHPIARSRAMRDILELAARVADTDTTVLLTGESGTGKEVLARLIHERSRRREGPFVGINCGALPEPVLESELFGHVRGAFTGAVADKRGLFEEAQRGTLFLDEVAEMPQTIQVKLLRALQEREIRRVGATKFVKVDARIVAASNRDVEEAANRGELRQDLYYRLNVIPIRLPPLRERREDIVPLAQSSLRRFARAQGKTISAISGEALERLVAYSWPGNVRELENVIERAVVLATQDRITVAELPAALQTLPASGPVDVAAPLPLAELERRSILAALERNHGNRTRTAKELQISGHTLWRKLKAYGIGGG